MKEFYKSLTNQMKKLYKYAKKLVNFIIEQGITIRPYKNLSNVFVIKS